MTDFFDEDRAQNRVTATDMVAQEARQFRLLQHLSNHDVAFRMAVSLNTVRLMRKQRNQINRPLYEIGLAYRIRVILGAHGIKTSGDLFELSDREILAMPKIGEASLDYIRAKLKEFFS